MVAHFETNTQEQNKQRGAESLFNLNEKLTKKLANLEQGNFSTKKHPSLLGLSPNDINDITGPNKTMEHDLQEKLNSEKNNTIYYTKNQLERFATEIASQSSIEGLVYNTEISHPDGSSGSQSLSHEEAPGPFTLTQNVPETPLFSPETSGSATS